MNACMCLYTHAHRHTCEYTYPTHIRKLHTNPSLLAAFEFTTEAGSSPMISICGGLYSMHIDPRPLLSGRGGTRFGSEGNLDSGSVPRGLTSPSRAARRKSSPPT